MIRLRPASSADHDDLVRVWRRAVEATHDFLTPDDVDALQHDVARYLPRTPRLLVADLDGRSVGFVGSDGDAVEMLFVDPDAHGRGVGTALLETALADRGAARVDVNEQNPGAHAFYAARGFTLVGRSALDDEGRPFPVLHLARPAGAAPRLLSDPAWEAEVAALWDDGTIDDGRRVEAMRALADRAPHPALGAFELGGAHDSAGHEAEADVQYRTATDAGLATVDGARAAQLVVQHASTLRNLGRIDEAVAMLGSASWHPLTGDAPRVFLALALHSAGRTDEALRVAVEALEPTLPRYHRSVRAYAAALTDR